jgi:hypothetical protein
LDYDSRVDIFNLADTKNISTVWINNQTTNKLIKVIRNDIIKLSTHQNFDFHPSSNVMIDFQLIYFNPEISKYFKFDEDDHLEPFQTSRIVPCI